MLKINQVEIMLKRYLDTGIVDCEDIVCLAETAMQLLKEKEGSK